MKYDVFIILSMILGVSMTSRDLHSLENRKIIFLFQLAMDNLEQFRDFKLSELFSQAAIFSGIKGMKRLKF